MQGHMEEVLDFFQEVERASGQHDLNLLLQFKEKGKAGQGEQCGIGWFE